MARLEDLARGGETTAALTFSIAGVAPVVVAVAAVVGIVVKGGQ